MESATGRLRFSPLLLGAIGGMAALGVSSCDAPSKPPNNSSNATTPSVSILTTKDAPLHLALAATPKFLVRPGAWVCSMPSTTEMVRAWRNWLPTPDTSDADLERAKQDGGCSPAGASASDPVYVDYYEDINWAFSPDEKNWLHGKSEVARIREPLPPTGADEAAFGPEYLYAYADPADLQPAGTP